MENNAVYNPDSKNGWIAVRRAMRFHPIVGMGKSVAPADPKRGSFSRYEAWQDLLMMACHAPSEWINKGRKVTLAIGQLGGAYSFLADRWNWTVKQVRGFLEKLMGDVMIDKETPEEVKSDDRLHSHTIPDALPKKGKQSNNLVQTITICNYRAYQVASEIDEIQKGQAKGKRRASEGHDSSNKETREQEDRSPNGDSSPAPQGDLLGGVAPEDAPLKSAKPAYSDSFEEFWKIYPHRKGKGAASKSWEKLSYNEKRRVYLALRAHLPALEAKMNDPSGGNYCPMPATWLSQKRYDDPVEQPKMQVNGFNGNGQHYRARPSNDEIFLDRELAKARQDGLLV